MDRETIRQQYIEVLGQELGIRVFNTFESAKTASGYNIFTFNDKGGGTFPQISKDEYDLIDLRIDAMVVFKDVVDFIFSLPEIEDFFVIEDNGLIFTFKPL